MSCIFRFLAVVVGLAAISMSGPSFAQRIQGYVQEVSGSVTGQVGTREPVKVEKGQNLVNNAVITTGPGSFAVLKFEDGTAVLLKQNSSFQVQNYAYNPKTPENANAIFNLLRGGLRLVTGLVTSRNRDAMKVATPLVTIGIRGTEFIAELVNPLFLQVIVGSITATNAAGAVTFNAGQFGVVTNSTTLGGLIPAGQVPPGVLQMPNVPLTSVPMTIPAGDLVGGAVVSSSGAAIAIGIGIAAGAAILGTNNNQTTTVYH